MDRAEHYYHQPTDEELEVERELSYDQIDRAINVLQLRYSPAPYAQPPPPRMLSPIAESGESALLRPGSATSGSSSRSSRETAVSQTALLNPQGYARVDANDVEDDYGDEYEYEYAYEYDNSASHQPPPRVQPNNHRPNSNPPQVVGTFTEPFDPGQRNPWTGWGISLRNGLSRSVQSRPSSHTSTPREPSPLLNRNAPVVNYSSPHRTARSRSGSPEDYDIGEKHDIEADPEKLPIAESADSISTLPLTPNLPQIRQHFGPVPVGPVRRRHMMQKKVKLHGGTFATSTTIPTKLVLPHATNSPEMKSTTYQAVTCDADDFSKKYRLRQNNLGRTTELMIVITMYNEDEILLTRTLYGVMKNIAHLCSRKSSKTWGEGSWEKVVVCIIADGHENVHPRVLDCLMLLGIYREDMMQSAVNKKTVQAHLFEYTTSFALDPELHFKFPDKGIVPTQILLLIKENNSKKINSHRWCLNAFAPLLQPNVIVLLDVGTRPGPKSLYKLWKTFDMNSNVGGACGEIAVFKGRRWSGLLNPLVAAQNFEYKMSNILDKPTEAAFGYISVLPGAFSAYRWIALKPDKNGNGPLTSYFAGEFVHGRASNIFESNMYLAEDRILCFELVARPNSSWVLRYVPGAIAETDVPDSLPEFILQRRRWLNGSFFAAIYALWHIGLVMRSGHSTMRKVLLAVEAFYNLINLIFAWFAVGNYFIFFTLLTSGIEDIPGINVIKYFNLIMQAIYASLLVASFLFSMGNKPRGSILKYQLTVVFFAILTLYMLVCAGLCAYRALQHGGSMYSQMLLSLLSTFGMYIASSLLAFDPWHLITCFIQYLLLSPSYVNVLNIYAFANLDDISWGTKGSVQTTAPKPKVDLGHVVQDSNKEAYIQILTDPELNKLYTETLLNIRERKPVPPPERTQGERDQVAKDYYANVRTNVLLFWVLSNGFLVLCVLSGGGAQKTFSGNSAEARTQRAYMLFILSFVAITSIIRFTASTLYGIAHLFTG